MEETKIVKVADLLKVIDHTELRPQATLEDYVRLADEAERYEVASVCVPPNKVEFMRKQLPEAMRICTVVGFPNGYNTLEAKIYETQRAISFGVDEIDIVIDIGAAVGSDASGKGLESVRGEIRTLRRITEHYRIGRGNLILKVIIETCYLSEAQKINLCKIVTEEGADFIKTSTGFGPKGAELADIELFRAHLGKDVKIKAAGGIKTIAQAKDFLNAGCSRIGSSGLVRLLAEVEGDTV